MKLHLLHTNDVHSQFENYMRLGRQIRSLRYDIQQSGEAVLTFDIGDILDRVRPETEASLGQVNTMMMAALGYDAWVLGNNEGLSIPVEGWPALVSGSDCVLFGTNIRHLSGAPVSCLTDIRVFDVGPHQVGVFGITASYEKPYAALGILATDPFEAAEMAVRELKGKGCRLIVALSHLGLRDDRRLAVEVPDIDVILGGHTHQFMERAEWIDGTAVFQAGKHALAFGHTVVTFDEERLSVTSSPVLLDPHGDYDAPMLHVFERELPEVESRLSSRAGQLASPLFVRYDWESPFSNALVDALTNAFRCDVGICNAGLLTASLLPGVIERRHIHAACTTPTRPVLLTLSGAELHLVIEQGMQEAYYHSRGFGYGFRGSVVGFLALSGLEAYVREAPDGTFALDEMHIRGEPVRQDQLYRVATSEYLWLSGIFPSLSNGRDVRFQTPLIRDVLLRAFGNPKLLTRAEQPRYTMVKRTIR